jgi:hypothetical protein
MDIHNEVYLGIGFENISFFVQILLKIAEKALLTFPSSQPPMSIAGLICFHYRLYLPFWAPTTINMALPSISLGDTIMRS